LGRPSTGVPSAFNTPGSRRAAAVLVLGLLLLAGLAGASAATDAGTSTLRAGPASDALSVAVTVGAMLAAAASAVLLWAFATRGRGASVAGAADRRQRPFWRRMLMGLFVGLLVGGAVALARKRKHLVRLPTTTGLAHAHATRSGKSAVHFVPAASISTVAVVALVLATLLVWSFLSARRHRRRWNLSGIILEKVEGTPAALSPQALLADSLATVRVPDPEDEADPRRAVVAAYLAMTHAAAAAGARRRGDETPSEFLQRLLDSLGASHEAARRLTFLFETARYSTKVFEETRRSEAIAALRQIRAELSLGVVRNQP
jgi:hypothetical protein